MSGLQRLVSQLVSQQINALQQNFNHRMTAMAESVVEMNADINELHRRINQMVRFGVVEEIHESNKLIKVKHGERSTRFIKWFTLAGGEMIHYRCPSVGELALLVDISSGASSQYLALCGWPSDKFPFPINNPKHVVTQFGELKMLWDSEKNELTLKAPTQIILDTPKLKANDELEFDVAKLLKIKTKVFESTGEIADNTRSMSEDRDLYNAHSNHVNGTPPSVSQ